MNKILTAVLFFCMLIAVFSCGKKTEKFSPLAAKAAPQSILAVLNPDLGSYKIKYYEAVQRDKLPDSLSLPSGTENIKENNEAFTILEHGPVDELPAEIKKPTVYVVFSQPVVPLAKLGQVAHSSDILKIEPNLQGTFHWYGTKMLAFESDTDALPQKLYKITINRDVKSLGGKSLSGENSFSFHTEYLKMLSLKLGDPKNYIDLKDAPLQSAKQITIHFNSTINLDLIRKSLIVSSFGNSCPYDIRRPINPDNKLTQDQINRDAVLTLKNQVQENTTYTVRLEIGAQAENDGLVTKEPQDLEFHTLLPFHFVDSDTYSYSFPQSKKGDSNPIFLHFSHPLNKTGVAAQLKITPPLPIKDSDLDFWGTSLKIDYLPVKYDTTYHITLAPTLRDIYGRTLGKSVDVKLEIGDPARYAYFPNEGAHMLEAQFPPKIIWEEQEVTKGSWKIGPIDDPYGSWSKDQLKPLNFSSIKPHTKHFEIVDLRPYLNKDGKGTVSLAWNLFQSMREDSNFPQFTSLTVQVTDLGLTLRYGYNKVIALVTTLSSGKTVSGAKVSLMSGRATQLSKATDDSGLVEFDLNESEARNLLTNEDNYERQDLKFRVKVEKGSDKIEFIPNESHNIWHNGVLSYASPLEIMNTNSQQTFLFSDRKIYRPGETLTYRGIDKTLSLGKYSSYKGNFEISLISPFEDQRKVLQTKGSTTESGGFFGTFILPSGLAPGDYILEYVREGSKDRQRETITVNFFKRLLFSTTLKKPERPYFAGDTLSCKLTGEYLSGGVLGGARYEGFWNKEPTYFRPEGSQWDNYEFGPEDSEQRYNLATFHGSLSTSGSAEIKQATTPEGIPGLAYTYNVGVNVTDTASNQLMSASESILVHPALFYLGTRFKNSSGSWTDYLEKGKDCTVETALVRPDGTSFSPQGTKVTAEIYFDEWQEVQQQGVAETVETRWSKVEQKVFSRTWQPGGPMDSFGYKPDKTGEFFILLKAEDPQGRMAVTKRYFYATGADWVRWYSSGDEDLGLRADKPIYKPGDTAKVLLQSPLPEGTYLMTIEREGLYDKKLLHIKGPTSVIEVPIKEEYLPIIYVAISSFSIRHGPPSNSYYEPDLGKPKGYFGILPLKIESAQKKIDLVILPDQNTYRPGSQAEVTIQAVNRGQPLADAEITFMAVDRGVVDLVNYHVPDPVKFFYAPEKFPLGVRGADSRSLLIDPVTYKAKDLQGGDAEDSKFAERKDFRPTAVFEPYLKTDSQGKVKIKFKLPDSLTTYRMTAVAVKDDLFGLAEGDMRIQNPINMRAALPRKLRQRDTAYAGVIVTNLDEKSRKVTVTAASNILTIDKETKKTLTLESGQTAEIAFDLAAERPGTGEIVFTLNSDLINEKLHQEFEVEKPYIYESVATIGKVTDIDVAKDKNGKVQGFPFAEEGLILPGSAPEGKGNLTLTLNATRIGNLHRAFAYTFQYPYGCIEQRTSKILPLIVFGDYIKAFGIESQVVDPKSTVQNELAYILKAQRSDGGFPVWPGDRYSNYYVSIRVAHILWYASKNGYNLQSTEKTARLLDYLAHPQEEWIKKNDWLMLYSAYVQSLHGRSVAGKIDEFAAKEDKLGLQGYGMLGLIYENLGQKDKAQEVLKRMKNFLRPSTRSIDLTETEENQWTGFYAGSGVAKMSVMLMLMQKLEPNTDMLQRLITSLTDRQTAGIWHNTDDTQWVLQALAQVIKAEESQKPNFTAEVSLDKHQLMNETFQGIKAGTKEKVFQFSDSPLKDIQKDAQKALRFEKKGPGTLFYSAMLRYAIPTETAIPRDEGIGLYTEITNQDGTPLQDVKKLIVGQIYKMKAVITSSKDRAWMALRMPIPSGAEILDAKLSTSALLQKPLPPKQGADSEGLKEPNLDAEFDQTNNHQEIYDNEVRWFFDTFNKGTQQVEFLFRAVNQGVYPVPPATIECMYEPEIWGRDLGRLFLITRQP